MQHETVSSSEILAIKPGGRPHGKHSLRIRRFQKWLEKHNAPAIDRFVFLDFAEAVGTRGVLVDLQKSLPRLLPNRELFKLELQAAVIDHRRRVEGNKMRSEILQAKWWRPFLPQSNLDQLHIHEVSRLNDWLQYLHNHNIRSPVSQDYMSFAAKWESEVPLVSLQSTFNKLDIPKVPSIEEELNLAISALRARKKRTGVKSRTSWPLQLSVSRSALPSCWQDILTFVETDNRQSVPISVGFLPTVEVALRTLCYCCHKLGLPVEINRETSLALVAELTRRNAANSTIQITVSALWRFARVLRVSDEVLDNLRNIERDFNRKSEADVPKKFETLDKIGSVNNVLGRAVNLLSASRSQRSLELRMANLNAATAVALFALIPLRVADTNMKWGEHLTHTGGRYRMDLSTSKCGVEFHGEICDFVTPFLDALLLRGCDTIFLERKRNEALQAKKPVFAHANGRHISNKCVRNYWQRHIGCGPHIARSVVHTELGTMGLKGVEMALSLCAQRDPRTAKFYQGKAMHDALLIQSNLLLLSGFSDADIREHFPAIENV